MKVVSPRFVSNTVAVIVQEVSVLTHSPFSATLCGSAALCLLPMVGVLVIALDLTYIPHC